MICDFKGKNGLFFRYIMQWRRTSTSLSLNCKQAAHNHWLNAVMVIVGNKLFILQVLSQGEKKARRSFNHIRPLWPPPLIILFADCPI
jgi:hypothetical protein